MCIFTAFPAQKETENYRKKNYVQKKTSQGKHSISVGYSKIDVHINDKIDSCFGRVKVYTLIHWLREESSSFI